MEKIPAQIWETLLSVILSQKVATPINMLSVLKPKLFQLI